MPPATPWGLPEPDLQASIAASEADLSALKGQRVLVTGGTGFLGSWLVASLLLANDILRLGLRLVITSRNPSQVPLSPTDALELVQADVRELPELGAVDLVVHGAASSSAPFGQGDGEPTAMAMTIIDGTRSVIDVASRNHAKVLFLSSGAVYGPQLAPVGEDSPTAPNPLDPHSSYGQAKRLAETLLASATASHDLEAVIARLFAFVGPRLPLDAHYAAGNFLNDVIHQRPVTVAGDGRPVRSYLYSGDLPEWCWAICARGNPGSAYNVGSSEPITIAALANRIAGLGDSSHYEVKIACAPDSQPAPWYVPLTDRARSDLSLKPRVGLDDALRKTLIWNASQSA